jgi:hypothetical protein
MHLRCLLGIVALNPMTSNVLPNEVPSHSHLCFELRLELLHGVQDLRSRLHFIIYQLRPTSLLVISYLHEKAEMVPGKQNLLDFFFTVQLGRRVSFIIILHQILFVVLVKSTNSPLHIDEFFHNLRSSESSLKMTSTSKSMVIVSFLI